MRSKKVQKPKAPPRSCTRQTLGERIKWLRAKSKPYMTLRQLSDLTGIKLTKLSAIENSDPKHINMTLNTLRKIAHGLDCQIFINLKRKPYPLSEECLPLGHTLPPRPKLKRIWTERGQRLAVVHGSYPWKNYHRTGGRRLPKSTSGKPGSDVEA